MRRIRVRTVGNGEDTDDEAEGDAEGVAEALSGCVVHVTHGDVGILPRGLTPG